MNDAITEQESDQFHALIAVMRDGVGSPEAGGLALVRAQFEGEDVAVVSWVVYEGDAAQVHPLAILTSDALVDRITPPEGIE